MSSIVHYTACPVCGSSSLQPVLTARDHTVSGKEFAIIACSECSLRITQDVPGADAIGPYYKSEDYISHTNTSRGLINRLYQAVRKRTLKTKRSLVKRATGLQKGRLLDVGSGIGAFANKMKQAGWQVTALEPDASARAVAKKEYDLSLEDISQLHTLAEGSFDAITLWHVLEHVHDLHGYVNRFSKLVAANGRLIIAVPNYTSKDAAIYGAHWAAYDVPRHLYHFSPASMKRLMEMHGMEIKSYHPMWYDSFYVSLLSSRYLHGKTNLAGAFFNGLRSNLAAAGNVKQCSSVIYVIGK